MPVRKVFSRGGIGKDFRIGAFDFETADLGGDVLFATACCEGELEPVAFSGKNIPEKLLAHMSERTEYIWYAHFAQYDWRYMLPIFREEPSRVEFFLRNDNSIFQIIYHVSENKRLVMRDSFAIWPGTLRDLAASFCPELPKLSIDIEHFDPANSEHVAYAKRDVETLCIGLSRFKTKIRELYGVNLSGTVASTALRAWERQLPKGVQYDQKPAHEKFFRNGYFGGIVFLTDTLPHNDCFTFDINSSYPYQMKTHGVPHGTVVSTQLLRFEYPGFYDVTVQSPASLRIPILPSRARNGSVLWQRGIFRTTVTSIELQFALQNGYKLIELHDGRVFPDGIVQPFAFFVSMAEEIRASFKGKPEETLAKLLQNSLYGKFGARRERRRLLSSAEANADELLGCEAWDEEGDWYVRNEIAENLRANPHWSAWITACGRLHILRIACSRGPETTLYGDTDSVTMRKPCIETGKRYGDFKLEKHWAKFRAIAPKVYAGQLADQVSRAGEKYPAGAWLGACKGLPFKKTNYREIYEKGTTSACYSTIPSLIVAMRASAPIGKREIVRRSTDIGNSASWQLGDDGMILPRVFAT